MKIFLIDYFLKSLKKSIWFILLVSNPSEAQIIPDNTLINNSSVTKTQENIVEIDGGTQKGGNLFHSFKEFSIRTGETASFKNANDIQNIFSRITGSSISEIDGIVKARGTANLFLINPNGIIFEQNAQLAIGGSFIASTADRIKFADGFEFIASTTQVKPLLTVSVPIGLGFGNRSSSIINRSIVSELDRNGNVVDLIGLRVFSGNTLALVGGEILIEGGFVTTQEGRIELGSIAEDNSVRLIQTNQGWALDYQGVKNFENISLSQAALIASDGANNNIQIQGKQVALTQGSAIQSIAREGQIGNLIVRASELINIEGNAKDAGFDFDLPTLLSNEVYETATGEVNKLIIETEQLVLKKGAAISTRTFGDGRGVDLQVNASIVKLEGGAQLSSETFGSGRAGSLTVNASESIKLTGIELETNEPSGLFADVGKASSAKGDGGNLTIETRQLIVKNGAQIGTTARNQGQGGIVTINASDSIVLSGISPSATLREKVGEGRSGIFVSAEPAFRDEESGELVNTIGNAGELNLTTRQLTVEKGAKISADTFGTGVGANATLNVDRLIIRDGGLIGAGSLIEEDSVINSSDRGRGGKITANASEFVEIVGSGSSLFTEAQGTGNAGNLIINTPLLTVRDGAQVTVSATGDGQAGSLTVDADSILLDRAGIEATTKTGDQGNITLNANDIILRRGSNITTNAAEEATGGDITINTDVLAALENSDITANAVEGIGGNIQIDTQGIFLSPDSQITAESELGIDGTVVIATPEVDPTAGVLELPSSPIDAESLIAKDVCRLEDGKIARGSSFIITGKGGLPPTAEDPLINSHRMVEWETVAQEQGNSTVTLRQRPKTDERGETTYPVIQQAQGWKIAPDGTLLLTAQATTATPQNPEGVSPHCPK